MVQLQQWANCHLPGNSHQIKLCDKGVIQCVDLLEIVPAIYLHEAFFLSLFLLLHCVKFTILIQSGGLRVCLPPLWPLPWGQSKSQLATFILLFRFQVWQNPISTWLRAVWQRILT